MNIRRKTALAVTLAAGLLVPAVAQAQCLHEPGALSGLFVLGFLGLLVGGLSSWLVHLWRTNPRLPKTPQAGDAVCGLENVELSLLQETTFGALAAMEHEYERMVLKKLETLDSPLAGERREQSLPMERVSA